MDLDSKPDSGVSVRAWLEDHPALAAVPRERTGGGAHLHFICRDLPEGVLKPWWSQWREDLRMLDLVKVAGELGILGGCLDPDTGKWAVRCPWQDQHSERAKGEPGSDTVIFNAPETARF